MRLKADTQIQQMLNAEMIQLFNDDRDELRKQAKTSLKSRRKIKENITYDEDQHQSTESAI